MLMTSMLGQHKQNWENKQLSVGKKRANMMSLQGVESKNSIQLQSTKNSDNSWTPIHKQFVMKNQFCLDGGLN